MVGGQRTLVRVRDFGIFVLCCEISWRDTVCGSVSQGSARQWFLSL